MGSVGEFGLDAGDKSPGLVYRKNGRDSGDKAREQPAAIDLTRVFKFVRYDRCKPVIDKYKMTDPDFVKAIQEAYVAELSVSPKKWQRFMFCELNKEFIDSHVFEKVAGLAKEKGLIKSKKEDAAMATVEEIDQKEALRRYLSRHGVSRGKRGAPRQEEREPIPKIGELQKELLDLERRLDKLEPPSFPEDLKDWHFYLFGESANSLNLLVN